MSKKETELELLAARYKVDGSVQVKRLVEDLDPPTIGKFKDKDDFTRKPADSK